MTQIANGVAGIDVAKDKVGGCIRKLGVRQTFPSSSLGHRQLVALLRKQKVTKAVMEASGGHEREWAKALREAGIEVRIVDPKRVRSFALSAGRLAKNDTIDAEMIAWFAETFDEAPSQTYDAAREELAGPVKARKSLMDLKNPFAEPDRACCAGIGAEGPFPGVEDARGSTCEARGCDLRQGQGDAGICRARRDH
ncbi:transposase [Bradyrhizobium sp. SZCCHNR2028]|uniref:IS110 family transposase n=1 Tax=Bradyrhizobium sp. SZCCHNR2028 TaxID=3057382 RepID=UPI0028ED328A|nr:transposase [Bradyrhizobium sp. SZCCHNR2028]